MKHLSLRSGERSAEGRVRGAAHPSSRPLRAGALLTTLTLLAACGTPTEPWPFPKASRVQGQLTRPDGLGGAAWLFLYRPGEGPPGQPAVPLYVTAIGADRLAAGDAHFVFASVKPNPFRLFGLLDVDGNFDPELDVLSQPGAGDRVGDAVDVNVQPGRPLAVDYDASTPVAFEPPAFHLEGVTSDVTLSFTPADLTTLTLISDALDGRLDSRRTAFSIGLVDADGDLRPDDVDGDGTPDLSLQLFLRWLPRPGQHPSGTTVVVPLVYNPAPFLLTLNGNLEARVVVTQVQAYPVPQATELAVDERGAPQLRPFGPPPTGDYELVALVPGGQFWRLPNQLRTAVASQAVRLHYDRASP